jgi:hypothetical protein
VTLLIFPLGVLLGWFIRPPQRAATVTAVVGGIAFVVMLFLAAAGASPIQTMILGVGTPIASWMAFAISRRRVARNRARVSGRR